MWKLLLIITAFFAPFKAEAAMTSAVLVLTPETQTTDGKAALERLKDYLNKRGTTLTELSLEEADAGQMALLGDLLLKADITNSTVSFKAYDTVSGKDISETFFPQSVSSNNQPAPEVKPAPVPVVQAQVKPAVEPSKPVQEPAPAPVTAQSTSRNHFGISAGMSTLKKNKDSIDSLTQNSSGGQSTTYDKTSGRFRLFYEHDFSAKYGFGIAAGAQKGGDEIYNNSGKTLNITATPKSATIYITRHFGRHFGLYAGGGADLINIRLEDPSDLAGMGVNHSPYAAKVTAPHGEAGLIFSAGDFSLRFSLKKILGGSSDDFSTAANGTNYRLIIRNGKTLAYKTAGQALASNEQYFKLDFGGFASAVTLNYAFAGW